MSNLYFKYNVKISRFKTYFQNIKQHSFNFNKRKNPFEYENQAVILEFCVIEVKLFSFS